jgi:K+-transporting ATPase KdpF subunit
MRINNARHHFHRRDRAFFRRGNPLCSRLRALEIGAEPMNAANAALLIICALLLGYLLYALLKAEKM